MTLNPSSEVPLFRQLVEQIKGLIDQGHLKPGDSLPSVRTLAKSLDVNPMTISKSISLLTDEGWLTYRRGQPSRVALTLPQNSGEGWLTPALKEVVIRAKQLNTPKEKVAELLEQVWQEEL